MKDRQRQGHEFLPSSTALIPQVKDKNTKNTTRAAKHWTRSAETSAILAHFQNLNRQYRLLGIVIWKLAGVQAGHSAEFRRSSPNSSAVCKPSGDDAEQDKTRQPPALTWLIVW